MGACLCACVHACVRVCKLVTHLLTWKGKYSCSSELRSVNNGVGKYPITVDILIDDVCCFYI